MPLLKAANCARGFWTRPISRAARRVPVQLIRNSRGAPPVFDVYWGPRTCRGPTEALAAHAIEAIFVAACGDPMGSPEPARPIDTTSTQLYPNA